MVKKVIIDQNIFDKFPDFNRGIIVVSDIENALNNKRIKKPLNREIENKMDPGFLKNKYVKAWDDAHLKFNSNPNKYPPSIKSLLKRIQKGGSFPFINSVVALFNYISIKYLIPCGGDDIDRVEGNPRLGFARGNEIFTPLGSTEEENPVPGEVIYFDDKTLNIMCRKWNWRNGDFTKITENTKKMVINIDGVGPIPQSHIENARDELTKLLINHCAARATTDLLNINKDNVNIDL